MPGIGVFTGVQSAAIGLDTRVVVSGDKLSAPSTHRWGRVVTACTSEATWQQQNRDTVYAFRAALSTRYGQSVGDLVFNQQLKTVRDSNAPLTARIITRADTLAKTAEFEQGLTIMFGKLAASQVLTALRGANPDMVVPTRIQMDQAHIDAAGIVDTQRNAAQTRITQLDTVTRDLYIADAGRESRVQRAIAQVVPACKHRLDIYAPVLKNALARLDPSLGPVEPAGAHALLARVAQQLADKLDHLALCGVVHHACNLNGDSGPPMGFAKPSGSYATMMANLNHGGIGLKNLSAEHPATLSQLCTLGDQLVSCIAEIGTRFHTDMALDGGDIGTRFAGRLATGLTDIELTDSDPHKGGHRVAILTMAHDDGNNTRVVYKPRDVRIDAKLVGSNNDAAVGASLAEYTEQRIAAHRAAHHQPANTLHLPTYGFMPRTDAHGDHYGYVQCLSHSTIGDQLMDVPQARDYHRNLGRQIAMLAFAGARDLHHTNMMVSSRQPYFTDLELSFDPDVFRLLAPGTKNSGDALYKMQVNMAVFSTRHAVWIAPATVVGGALTLSADYHPRVQVTENRFHVLGAFEDGTAIDGNNRQEARTFANFSLDVRTGFSEVIDAFTAAASTAQGREEFNALIDGFGGMHARYHPVGTPEHLASVKQRREYAGPAMSATDMTARMLHAAMTDLQKKNKEQELKPPEFRDSVMLLQQHHEADWAIGDVPYFVRPLGTVDCLHNGLDPVADPARDGRYFGVNPLQQSKDMFADLAHGDGKQGLILTEMADNLVTLMAKHTPTG